MAAILDACSIALFMCELNHNSGNTYQNAMQRILNDGNIVLDKGEKCYAEWKNTAEHKNGELSLADWLSDLEQRGKVDYCDYKRISDLEAALKKLGVPREDRKWVHLLFCSDSENLVSDDIDLYDPSLKGQSAACSAKQNSRGPVAKMIRKNKKRVCCLDCF